MKKRATGIIIKNEKILLMRRIKNGEEYFVFPGGSVEENETTKEAVIREIKEGLMKYQASFLFISFANY